MGASGVSGGNCLERRARTNLCPGDDARLDDHFGLRAEVLRLPQDQVCERADRDLPDKVRDAVREGAVHTASQFVLQLNMTASAGTYGLMVYLDT